LGLPLQAAIGGTVKAEPVLMRVRPSQPRAAFRWPRSGWMAPKRLAEAARLRGNGSVMPAACGWHQSHP